MTPVTPAADGQFEAGGGATCTRAYVIRLQHDGGNVPAELTLRRVLKMTGAAGLKCVDVRAIDGDENKPGQQLQEKQQMTQQQTQLMVRPAEHFMPIMSPAQAIERRNAMVAFVKKMMKPTIDFGVIPGTDKPTLLKPGAEKLCTLFGLTPRMTIIEKVEDWTGEKHSGEPFFHYHYRASLLRGDQLIAEAEGSCNSRETKYRYRKSERTCPTCGVAAIIKSKAEFGGGWFCFPKRGGCGAKFSGGDASIESQEVGRVANPDICDSVNTLMKMAQKRAFVAATLAAVNASEFFTGGPEEIDVGDDAIDSGGDDDDDVFRVDQNGEPDLSHSKTFVAEWAAEMAKRGFDGGRANEVLETTLSKSRLRLEATKRPWRSGVLKAAREGKFDHLKPATATAAAENSEDSKNGPGGETSTFDQFVAAAWQLAAAKEIDRATFDRGIEMALLAARCKGKPEKTTPGWRRDHLDAIRVGAFDFAKGTVNEVDVALGVGNDGAHRA